MITINGLGDKSNAYSWSLQEYQGKLYLGTFNDGLYGGIYDPIPIPLDGRAQLWCTEDGKNWTKVVDDGFGSPFNYGIRTMTVSDNRLIVGTASNFLIYDPMMMEIGDLSAYFTTLIGKDGQIDWASFQKYMEEHPTCNWNWIGTEVWASTEPVPEPATITLIGLGILGAAASRRKKR